MGKSIIKLFFQAHFFTRFKCRPSDSTVSEDADIEPRTVATLALTDALTTLPETKFLVPGEPVRQPYARDDNIPPPSQTLRSHPHSARSHPQAARLHPKITVCITNFANTIFVILLYYLHKLCTP